MLPELVKEPDIAEEIPIFTRSSHTSPSSFLEIVTKAESHDCLGIRAPVAVCATAYPSSPKALP